MQDILLSSYKLYFLLRHRGRLWRRFMDDAKEHMKMIGVTVEQNFTPLTSLLLYTCKIRRLHHKSSWTKAVVIKDSTVVNCVSLMYLN